MESLPLPVSQHQSLANRPRFELPGARISVAVHWARLKRRINGSAPDESLGEPTGTDASDNGSLFPRKNTRDGTANGGEKADDELELGVDEIVVDQQGDFREWGTKRQNNSGTSEHAGGTLTSPGTGLPHQSEASSQRGTAYESSGVLGTVANFCRWRAWPVILHFFHPVYHDKALEEAYQKEQWFTQKSIYIFGACFLVLNWVLAISLLPHPWSLWNKIQNYALGPALAVPLVPMAIFDIPRRQKWIWQFVVLASVWISASGNIVDMNLCNYYIPELRHCANRDFQATLYYATALPVISLFALGQTRAVAAFAGAFWFIMVGILILPVRIAFIRNALNVLIFQSFVIYLHYRRDLADRRMYTMRAELKVQFRAKQKAQISERKAMDSNRRFSSYIFHEVRVPLNTALLAVQNLEGAQVFDKTSDQAVEYAALEGSLQMMSQVLNDVLDFTRMEKGGFSSVSRPFSFHNVMRSIFVPLRLDADARGLQLETSLDRRIDEVAHRLAFQDEEVNPLVGEGDGLVMGDEMRLRQVINNLCSNAAKFTSPGGTITVRTRLVYPTPEVGSQSKDLSSETSGSSTDDSSYSPRLSANRLQQHEAKSSSTGSESRAPTKDVVVVRIEIQDTGVGILAKDMFENRLFSAYVQTEIGRHQGGKGTGLGLSLVRQIVLLTGGRLGLKSRVGEGSTFWVELPFLCGPQVRKGDSSEPHRRVSSSTKEFSMPRDANAEDRHDLRFIPALRHAPSDLDLIEETSSRTETIELAPTNYRFSGPPASHSIHNGPIQPRFYGVGDLSPSPPPIPITFQTPFPASQPKLDYDPRPEHKSHLSTSSAPSTVAKKVKAQALEFPDGPLRVLVVDDDTLTRRLMSRMMERLGCLVDSAENGKVALEMLLATTDADKEETPPGVDPRSSAPCSYDVTFLDNQMPILTGPEVVSRLRALARDDLVVAITANAQLSEQEAFTRNGASAVLTKPVLEDDLRRYLIIADQQRTERKSRKQLARASMDDRTFLPPTPPPAVAEDDATRHPTPSPTALQPLPPTPPSA
ncbi:hypothetical protein RQP46_005276 [Phenoliferia psychrophenolica]